MSDDFWDAAAPLLGEGVLEEGTIMGGACVRSDGIVVKLPRERVEALIESGAGASFAPAGKVFKEWVSFVNP
jgi:hypothetical protein